MGVIKTGMDLINRAKKLYGNKEALTNAIHSCIMSDNTNSQIIINITTNTDDLYKITTLFPCVNEEINDESVCYTELTLSTKNKTAKTFFEKYNTEESFKEFILSHFFLC